MLGLPARLAAFGLASLFCAAAFVACIAQTSGLELGRSGLGGGAGASSSTGGAAGQGGGATGGGPASEHDAGGDAAPVEAGSTVYASCKALLGAEPDAGSGVYNLSDSSQNVYQAYCDMVDDGGGWTLALKIDGNNATFLYDAALWTNTMAYNAGMPALDTNEAKLASFWSVPFTALRVGMIDSTDSVTRWLDVPVGGSSLLELIDVGGMGDAGATSLGVIAWEGLLANGSIQTNCNWEGINADSHVRIGLVGDDGAPQCLSPDSFLGFGADTFFETPYLSCGNTAHYDPDHGDRSTPAFGYVMVR
jgi:hypothetical protein